MLFRRKNLTPLDLKPFAIQLEEGFLLGLTQDAEHAAPCARCVLYWLQDRNVKAKRVPVEAIRNTAKVALDRAISERSPHVLFETTASGHINRLECLIFPHRRCHCAKTNFVAPTHLDEHTNLAFSPIYQIKCVRYGTPSGSVWRFSATGESPGRGKMVTAFAAHEDKETARLDVVDSWLKKAALADVGVGSELPSEDLLSGKLQITATSPMLDFKGMGIGGTKEEATLNALYGFAQVQTVRQYAESGKNPMLVVGANSWLRQRVPYFLLQQYDLYLLFYPNTSPAWVVGLGAFSRSNAGAEPLFVFGSGSNPVSSMQQCVTKILEFCRPSDWRKDSRAGQFSFERDSALLNRWWTHWIYRCPKINLKDILQLDPHPRSLEVWRAYLHQEGPQEVSIQHLNHSNLPGEIRHLVRLQVPDLKHTNSARPQFGIATWSSFKETAAQV